MCCLLNIEQDSRNRTLIIFFYLGTSSKVLCIMYIPIAFEMKELVCGGGFLHESSLRGSVTMWKATSLKVAILYVQDSDCNVAVVAVGEKRSVQFASHNLRRVDVD